MFHYYPSETEYESMLLDITTLLKIVMLQHKDENNDQWNRMNTPKRAIHLEIVTHDRGALNDSEKNCNSQKIIPGHCIHVVKHCPQIKLAKLHTLKVHTLKVNMGKN